MLARQHKRLLSPESALTRSSEVPNHSVALQPLSVQGQVGLNAAGGIGALDLHYDNRGRFRPPRQSTAPISAPSPRPPEVGAIILHDQLWPLKWAGIVALHVTGQHSLGCRDRAVKECAASSLSSQCRRAQRYSVIAVARAAEGLGLRTKETTSAVLAAGRFAAGAHDENGEAKRQQHQRLFHGRPPIGSAVAGSICSGQKQWEKTRRKGRCHCDAGGEGEGQGECHRNS
jgi:hypothetical protein